MIVHIPECNLGWFTTPAETTPIVSLVHHAKKMKATLKFLKDFYSPLHKKTFIAEDAKKNSIEIDVDDEGLPLHSFWFAQLKDSPDYFELIVTSEKQPKKAK